MAEKRTRDDKALRQSDRLEKTAEARPEHPLKDRRREAIRSGSERRKIAIPPPPGSPVRSGVDRRAGDRRSKAGPGGR